MTEVGRVMSPEHLGRVTGFTVEQWRQAQMLLGDAWAACWRPVCELATVTGSSPAAVAYLLTDPDEGVVRPYGSPRRRPDRSRVV